MKYININFLIWLVYCSYSRCYHGEETERVKNIYSLLVLFFGNSCEPIIILKN